MTDPDERRIRVVLADDHTLFRDGLAELIQTDPAFQVVGQAADGDKVLALVPVLRPDIVIVDVEMPGPGARAVVSRLRQVCPEATVIVLTMHQNSRIVQELLDCGAAAYLVKNIARDQLIAALHAVHQSPRNVLLSVSRETLGRGEPAEGGGRPLSAREMEVLRLTADAYSNSQIATRLGITEATVKRHLSNIYAKLGAVSRVDSVRKAMAARLINPVIDSGRNGRPPE
ncbi:response regulator transcription factor [Planomonospora parontospora]|uniref:response regulator transcription factor n=1 Tax=Planomonospora parontospora TaxID=58119 RepID=UPI00166FF303|nr:response regulator transcription factor [Planomonospora parontospora]GGL14273.1 DNA-binding response regulator [Planomonospora parontospora subsp. antibiotica]GII17852.1 DNA-binding response regulator [Planomonospora parontospora subsp. antibiotica]